MKTQGHRFVLVTRKTRLQELIERFNTWPQAKFYLEHSNAEVSDYLAEHDLYQKQLDEVERILKPLGRLQKLERAFLPNYQFSAEDVVVIVGQDGLVANALKYLDGNPVIAINPDPDRWDGTLLPFEVGNLKDVALKTMADIADSKTITFVEARTNDGQVLLGVNDLFIGPKSHTSARYNIHWNGQSECHSSSGIIISTGFGSTGWFQSILAGAMGVSGVNKHDLSNGFAWDSKRVQFAVREPFPSNTTGTDLVFGSIDNDKHLELESLMPENGVMFSDGIQKDFIAFNSGCTVTVGISKKFGRLIV
ncbi:MAG: NAD kinase [Arenicella sp.]|jgi:NAD kinase